MRRNVSFKHCYTSALSFVNPLRVPSNAVALNFSTWQSGERVIASIAENNGNANNGVIKVTFDKVGSFLNLVSEENGI